MVGGLFVSELSISKVSRHSSTLHVEVEFDVKIFLYF